MRIIGATLTSVLGSTNANHGSPGEDAKRKALNEFVRNGGRFDGVADFDAATLDPRTGGMRAEFVPDSTTGGPGDKIHPNRVGYLAMGTAIDLNLLAPIPVTWRWPSPSGRIYRLALSNPMSEVARAATALGLSHKHRIV